MIGIYKITSPTNKVYIGQSININRRFKSYKKLNCKTQIKLYKSFKKHGVDNHKFEVITECEQSELNELERYYQELYNVLDRNYGLNLILQESKEKVKVFSRQSLDKKRISLIKSHEQRKVKYYKKIKCVNKYTKEMFEGGVYDVGNFLGIKNKISNISNRKLPMPARLCDWDLYINDKKLDLKRSENIIYLNTENGIFVNSSLSDLSKSINKKKRSLEYMIKTNNSKYKIIKHF